MVDYPKPGIRLSSYISHMPGKYHVWFQNLGYWELDIEEYKDGSWAIYQFHRTPVVPSLTPNQVVLGYMKHTEISYSFCEKFAKKLDIRQKEFWAREQAKTREVEDEHARGERHHEDLLNRAHSAFMRNPDILNRIAANGTQEMNLDRIARHVPKSMLYKSPHKGERIATYNDAKEAPPNVSHSSQSTSEIVST